MTAPKRTVNAAAICQDIRSGIDSVSLRAKYGLSQTQLTKTFDKLLERGLLEKTERDSWLMRDRAQRLFAFLQELRSQSTTAVRSTDSYERVPMTPTQRPNLN
jgi:hypothetical protein